MKKLNSFAFLSLFAMIVFCSSKEASVKEFIVDTSGNVTTRLGGDLDEHGCDVSGGYTWSEVLQDCIRLFEQGSVLRRLMEMELLFLFLVAILFVWSFSFLMGGKVKYWSNMPCLKEVMLGVRQMMARKMYN